MAVIKIQRSDRRVTPYDNTQVSAAALPVFQIANIVESGVTGLIKPIEDAKKKTKKTQDINDARSLMMEANKTIILEADKYKNSSKVADVNSFFQNTQLNKFEELLKPYNKEVKSLFATELYKTANSTGMKLFAEVLKRHGELTQDNKRKDLFNLNLMAASNDIVKRNKAAILKSEFFTNPDNLNIFGAVELNKMKEASVIETKLMQYEFRTKNEPLDILLLGEENIANDLANEKLAKHVINNAENTLISKSIQENKINEINFKADTNQKLSNFTYILTKLNNDDIKITLDDINDLYKKDQLNSVQRNALYDLFANPNKLSEQNVVDMVEGLMMIAESVEDIDELQRQILSDPEFVSNLGLTEFSKYNSIFNKYQKDLPAFKEYQKNKKLLEADLGKVTNSINFVHKVMGTALAIKPNEKLRINAVDYYDQLIIDGATPADAYIQSTEAFLRGNNIPVVQNFTGISSITLNKPTKDERENPSLYIENRTKELTELYKNHSIDINTFSKDLAALDSIDNLITLRMELNADPFGFDTKNENKIDAIPEDE